VRRGALIVLVTSVLLGCRPGALSPPAYPTSLEPVSVLPASRVAIDVSGAYGISPQEVQAAGGELAIRVGLDSEDEGRGVELRAGGSTLGVLNAPVEGSAPEDTTGFAGRLGARYSVGLVSLRFNVGAGYSPMGGFVAPTTGLALGESWEREGFWAAIDFGFSAPVEPLPIAIRDTYPRGERIRHEAPEFTWLIAVAVGGYVTLGPAKDDAPQPMLLVAGTWNALSSPSAAQHFFGVTAGLSFPL
jgi:hypothetical protein